MMPSLRRSILASTGSTVPRRVILTGMIDVVFLLMIYLLFGQFRLPEGEVVATLVRAGPSAPAGDRKTSWITIRRVGRTVEFAVDDDPPVTDGASLARALADRMRGANPASVQVIVDPLPGTSVADLMVAWDAALSAGIRNIGLRVHDAGMRSADDDASRSMRTPDPEPRR